MLHIQFVSAAAALVLQVDSILTGSHYWGCALRDFDAAGHENVSTAHSMRP